MISPEATSILVAVDFSPESDAAVQHAFAIARRTGAGLVLLHACAVPEPAPPGERADAVLAGYRARLEAELAADRARLEDLRVRLSGQGVEVSHILVDDFADSAIVDAAAELDAGLVAVGSHGRTGLRWLFLGSVARRVIRLAQTDVLVARGQPPVGGYRHICVATDFSPSAERALAAAMELVRPDARVDLVHFWHLPPVDTFPGGLPWLSASAIDELSADLRAAGEALVRAHARPGVKLSFEPIFAPTLPGLVQHLERGEHDLVVLGSHGRRGVRRFVLGSVAETTAARAPCSALIVHAGKPR